MKYEEIEELYNKLDSYLNSVAIGPEHDNLLNQLTKLSKLLDSLDEEIINQKSKELLSDLENKKLDNLIKDSIIEVNEITTSIDKVTRLVGGLDNVISKLTILG